MPQDSGLDRRAFLRNAGATALLGAVGVKPAMAAGLTEGPSTLQSQVFDFDEIYSRVGTDCTKWDGAIATYGEGIEVGMGIADMDFRAAPCITRALAERSEHENWGYLLRMPARYVDGVVDWNRRRYGLDIDPDTIVWTTGVHPGLVAALQTFAPPGTRVLLTTPTYNGFYTDLRFTRTVAENSPMKPVEGRYSIDFEDFERRATRANVFILCNPQNPTGNCWSPEDLTRMGEICLRHRVVVLADEIHCDFVMSGQTYTPFASLPNREIVDNSLTFKSASKTFSLAAMKVAWYFSTNPDYLARVKANTRADLATLGMVASHAALTEGEPWLDQLLVYIDGNHDFAESHIRDRVPLVKYTKAQGTFLAWLDVSDVVDRIGAKRTAAKESEVSTEPVTPEDIVQRWLADNAGVFLNPGSSYGTGGAGHMRMNLATSRRLIERALDNMATALARA
ncbi:MAG: aminotransferase class I/II-fold pyridoxal phosphate-dependent enzyme [Gemmatimonadetes bacterium]|nr:aminotransferase class I/II-fold pyridoxal phosphate-dependent enzyme [Gemmatimonadota bacterium]